MIDLHCFDLLVCRLVYLVFLFVDGYYFGFIGWLNDLFGFEFTAYLGWGGFWVCCVELVMILRCDVGLFELGAWVVFVVISALFLWLFVGLSFCSLLGLRGWVLGIMMCGVGDKVVWVGVLSWVLLLLWFCCLLLGLLAC